MQIPQFGEVIFVGGGGLGQAGYKKSSQLVKHHFSQFSSAAVQISRHPEKNKGQGKLQRSKKGSGKEPVEKRDVKDSTKQQEGKNYSHSSRGETTEEEECSKQR